MTGQQLKNSILQLAIQGKLVPQIESEGTAEDLLKEIRAEKEKLVKEGKLKKKDLEVKPIEDDEIPFEIPESWKWVRLGKVFSMQAGKTINASELTQEQDDSHQYRCYGGNGVRGFINRYNNDGLFPIVGRQGALCGCVNMANGKFQATEHAVVVSTYASTNEYWAYYFLIASNLNQYATATAQPGLSVANILETYLPLPPLSEQKRIVAKIEELMPLVEEYGKAQERLETLNRELPEKLKKSVLQEAIMGKLVPQDPKEGTAEELVKSIKKVQIELINEKKIKVGKYNKEINKIDLPQGWCCVKLGDISSLITKQTGFDYSNTIKPNLIEVKKENTIPMIQTKNFKGKSFDLDTDYYIPLSVAEKFPNIMLNEKCMLLSIVGASVGNVGVYNEGKLGIIGGAICKVVLLDERLYDYIYYFLRSPQGHNEIRKNFKSTAQGTITVQDVREIQIPLPPLEEQKRIVEKVEEVMEKIEGMK